MDLPSATRLSEGDARRLLERLRWPEGPRCPGCRGNEATRFRDDSSRPGVFKCRLCERQFTVTTGTILHGSHVPLRTWVAAFCLVASTRRGVSALELKRRLELSSYHTAWSMMRRMHQAVDAPEFALAGSPAQSPKA